MGSPPGGRLGVFGRVQEVPRRRGVFSRTVLRRMSAAERKAAAPRGHQPRSLPRCFGSAGCASSPLWFSRRIGRRPFTTQSHLHSDLVGVSSISVKYVTGGRFPGGRGNLRDRVAPNPDREGDRGSSEGVPSWGTGLPRRFPMGPRCPFSSRDSEKRELVPRSTNRRSCVRRAWPGRNRIGPRGSCPLFCAEQRKGRGLFSFAENRRFLVQEQGGLSLPLPLPGNLCIIYPNVVAARSSCPELFSGEPAYVPPLPTPYPRFPSFFERERERVRLHIL